jgi:hypothetical protein
MTIRCYTLLPRAASRSRTHTPYSKRSGWNCPEKSTEVPELLPDLLHRDLPSAASRQLLLWQTARVLQFAAPDSRRPRYCPVVQSRPAPEIAGWAPQPFIPPMARPAHDLENQPRPLRCAASRHPGMWAERDVEGSNGASVGCRFGFGGDCIEIATGATNSSCF